MGAALRSLSTLVFTALFLAISTTSAFAAANWKLSADEQKRLDEGGVVVRTRDVAGSPMKKATAFGVIDATPERVLWVLSDFENWPKFMPRMKETKVRTRDARSNQVWVYEKLSMPWPLDDIYFVVKIKTTKKGDMLSTRFSMVPGSGNMKYNNGGWDLIPYKGDPKRCLARYTLHSEPNAHVPNFLINYGTKTTIPDVYVAMRKHATVIRP